MTSTSEARRNPGSDKRAKLSRLIEDDIIPRLLLANRVRQPATATNKVAKQSLLSRHVGEFSDLVVQADASVSFSYFDAMLENGAAIEDLYIELLAPTARRLGELWDKDINDFFDVTRGLSHLQQIVRQHSAAFDNDIGQPIRTGRVLLMTLPGEQHTLGITIVDEFFRRDGWQVWSDPPASIDHVVDIVSDQWLDVVGFSISRTARVSELTAAIRLIRQSSFNPKLTVLVGGKPFIDQPDLVGTVGADATAIDGRHAVQQVRQMLGARAIQG